MQARIQCWAINSAASETPLKLADDDTPWKDPHNKKVVKDKLDSL